jgi:hypothetical protein
MTTSYTATETAKFVRVTLKENFPGIKFSVKSSNHVINISWTDGPIDKQVEAVTNAFGGMSFDGMQDMDTYRKQEYNGEQAQFYCYSPYTKRKLSMEFATKIKASMERQHIPCPSLKWCNYDECASFQTQELDWHDCRRFNEKVRFFTVNNVDTLNFWGEDDGSGCRAEKLEYELLNEVIGTAETAKNPTVDKVVVTHNEQKDGVEIKFCEKPAQAIIDELNQSDFKWSRKQNIWYAKRTAETLAFAYEMAGMVNNGEFYQLSAAEILEVRKLQQTPTALVPSNTVSMAVFVARRNNQPVTAVAQVEKQIDFSYLLN